MQVQFNQSQLKIIDLLVKVKYFMTVGDMSEKVKVSERSVYKNLSSLNKKLKTLDIEGTRNVYGQGYYLSEKSKQQIQKYLATESSSKYSSLERQYIVFINLLIDSRFSVQKIAQGCGVSKQTILKDIQSLKQKMKSFEITIVSNYRGDRKSVV